MLQELSSFIKSAKNGKLSIFCVGNDLRGDDGIGLMIYHKLRSEFRNKLLIYNVGISFENFLSVIAKENVTHCLIIDAIKFGNNEVPAGTIGFFKTSDLQNTQIMLSTHLIPMKIFVDYIKKQSEVIIRILGIKPKILDFSAEMSLTALNAIDKTIDMLIPLLRELYT